MQNTYFSFYLCNIIIISITFVYLNFVIITSFNRTLTHNKDDYYYYHYNNNYYYVFM